MHKAEPVNQPDYQNAYVAHHNRKPHEALTEGTPRVYSMGDETGVHPLGDERGVHLLGDMHKVSPTEGHFSKVGTHN